MQSTDDALDVYCDADYRVSVREYEAQMNAEMDAEMDARADEAFDRSYQASLLQAVQEGKVSSEALKLIIGLRSVS